VETQEALDHLAHIGCEEAQGYFLQRPVPAAQLSDWVSAWTAVEDARHETSPTARLLRPHPAN
jgi:predicted signal transduction protein with EAL and GGDEF domain